MLLLLLGGCLLLPGSEALKGPKEVSGFEGDSVSFQCSYKEELKQHQKYWCKEVGLFLSRCSRTIYSGEDGQEVTSGKVSIRDNLRELAFTVTLRNLTLEDRGKYWCGVKRLGTDDTFKVSLVVFPGPCCLLSPPPSFQPLATRSLQPKAKAWHTQPPELTSPGLHLRVTTAKQGKTGATAPPHTGTSLHVHAGSSVNTEAPPRAVTRLHSATSPSAGSSHLTMQLDPTSAKGTSPSPISSSRSRVSVPLVRILAPVLVLLGLLLAAGLVAVGSCVLRRREVHVAMETEKHQKAHLSPMVMKEVG
ncbi:CMRF35-like molecule 9 [Tenrec ecaudatus]|uniref:CMRF35-like molecule 9 n=1 Tax=Tenrec ecaudatus TaxID=94439 RepID=UPI003F5A28BE